jgi:hypothetical protein
MNFYQKHIEMKKNLAKFFRKKKKLLLTKEKEPKVKKTFFLKAHKELR